jgi:hypothetical protein
LSGAGREGDVVVKELSETAGMYLRGDPVFFAACRRAVGEAVEESRDGLF